MKKAEFIKMLQQDNETRTESQKSLHAQVIDCTIIALLDESADFEIESRITSGQLLEVIKEEVKKNGYCVGPFEASRQIAEVLKTKNDGATRLYNMAMGLFEGNAPTPRKSRISLDDI